MRDSSTRGGILSGVITERLSFVLTESLAYASGGSDSGIMTLDEEKQPERMLKDKKKRIFFLFKNLLFKTAIDLECIAKIIL